MQYNVVHIFTMNLSSFNCENLIFILSLNLLENFKPRSRRVLDFIQIFANKPTQTWNCVSTQECRDFLSIVIPEIKLNVWIYWPEHDDPWWPHYQRSFWEPKVDCLRPDLAHWWQNESITLWPIGSHFWVF